MAENTHVMPKEESIDKSPESAIKSAKIALWENEHKENKKSICLMLTKKFGKHQTNAHNNSIL